MAITKVNLVSVPLEKDYSHTLWFNDEATQRAYFLSKKISALSYTDLTYQRKDGVLRVPEQIDTLWKNGINYVMYQNSEYNNKWFYAFITDMQYVNDGRTDVTIKTDCLQTWMFEKVVKPCFVEREHTKNDEVGANTIPECLETGEFICKWTEKVSELYNTRIVVATTEDPDGLYQGGQTQNGLYSGLMYWGVPLDRVTELNNFIKRFDENGKTDAIQSIFYAPFFLINNESDNVSLVSGSAGAGRVNKSYSKNVQTSNTDIRNNKLKCYPYSYLLVSNNAGGSAVYHYEHFKNETIDFAIYGALTPGCSVRLVPRDYKGVDYNFEEGLNLGKYPICNWASDVYTNWLTQNGVNIGLNLAAGVGQIAAGTVAAIGTAGAGSAIGGAQIVSGVSAIATQLAQIHQMSFTPPQSNGNINCGDVVTASNNTTFTFYAMTIKEEYIKVIDEYFDMYGYKTHRVKIPEENHRENYWFTKTIDANIEGTIPQEDLQTIKDCYNRGVTFWRNTGNFRRYKDAAGNPLPNGTL